MKQYALAPPCVECARCHRVFKADAALDVLLRDNKRVLLDLVKALGDRRMTYARHKEISNIFYACGDGIAPHLFALLLAPSVLHGDAYGPLLSRIQTFRWQPSTDDDRTIFYLNTGNSKTLVEMGERALSGLHKCLLAGLLTPSGACWQTHVDTLMKAAKDAIVSLRDAAIPDACRLLLHQDPKVRKTGAQILGGVASPACAPPLLAAFTDSDAPVRAMITWALGKIHSADVISALVAGTSDVDPDVRKNSVSAMMRIEDQRCRDAVVTLLDSEKNEAVLEVAIVSVGHFKDARAVPALASLLRAHWDRATNLTVRAAHLLGVIGGTEAVAVLLEAVGLVGQGKTLFDAKTSDPSSEPYCFGPVCEALAMLRCAQAIGPLTRVYTAHPSSSFAECAGKAIWSILAAAIRDVSTPDLESVLETESFKYSSGVVFNSWDDSSFSREYHYDMTEAHLMARSELSRRSSP